jgi:hypothetical protein
MVSPELASSLAFRLLASCREALVPLSVGLLRLPAIISGLFFFRAIIRRNSFNRAGDI